MLSFTDLLSRADAALLQDLIGPSVVKLLFALDSEKAGPGHLRSILLELHPAAELLLSRESRPRILELLRSTEAAALLEYLSIEATGDTYGRLLALPVRRGSSLSILLLSFFGLTEPEKEPELVPPGDEIDGGYELFPHQRAAALKVTQMLDTAPYRVLLHMPTGSGKTRTAMSLVAGHLRGIEEGLVIWLAAAEELCDQAAEEFATAWSKLGNRRLHVHRWWGNKPLGGELPTS